MQCSSTIVVRVFGSSRQCVAVTVVGSGGLGVDGVVATVVVLVLI